MFHSTLSHVTEQPDSKPNKYGKFGRVFHDLAPAKFEFELLDTLAKNMKREPEELPFADTRSLPAGYVYFGQFIAHDLSFDPNTSLNRVLDPTLLENFRTPTLDLDSLYGNGPQVNPIYYRSLDGYFPIDDESVDLLRKPKFKNENFSIALIPDPRNDENRIVSQIHLLFQKLHNYLLNSYQNFDEAKKYTQWHYQWLILNEFLPKIIKPDILSSIFDIANPSMVKRAYYFWRQEPFIPIEFSNAAYRFGHSMVRSSYIIRKEDQNGFIVGAYGESPLTNSIKPTESLLGFKEQKKGVDLNFFFGKNAQKSHPIEPRISSPLYDVTRFNREAKSEECYQYADSLPFITMRKGMLLGLPNGEDVAKEFNQTPINVDLQEVTQNTSFKNGSTPLWYYILHEAKVQQEKEQLLMNTLGPVASIIVAEVIIGVLQEDKSSYVNQNPNWKPSFYKLGEDFSMVQLIEKLQT